MVTVVVNLHGNHQRHDVLHQGAVVVKALGSSLIQDMMFLATAAVATYPPLLLGGNTWPRSISLKLSFHLSKYTSIQLFFRYRDITLRCAWY